MAIVFHVSSRDIVRCIFYRARLRRPVPAPSDSLLSLSLSLSLARSLARSQRALPPRKVHVIRLIPIVSPFKLMALFGRSLPGPQRRQSASRTSSSNMHATVALWIFEQTVTLRPSSTQARAPALLCRQDVSAGRLRDQTRWLEAGRKPHRTQLDEPHSEGALGRFHA